MRFRGMLLVVVAMLLALPAFGQAPPGKLRVLVTVGGHGFEQKPFYAFLDKLPGVTYTKIDMPKQADLLKPGLEKQYDVILMYDMVPALSEQQQKNYVALLNSGIGVVSWHHNLCANSKWAEYRQILGGVYLYSDAVIDGRPCAKSNYTEGIDYHVHIADPDHPITKGLKDFDLHDEVYGSRWIAPDSHVLLTTDCPKSDPALAWTHRFGKSRIVYLMPGHGSKAWAHPMFQQLMLNCLHWAAGK